MKPLCLAAPADAGFGTSLAASVGADFGLIDIHEFPDGGTRVRLPGRCDGRRVLLVAGGRQPNRGALPLHFAAHAARELGADDVGLVAPYLPYMRQDSRFHEGEAVSARAYARFLSGAADWLVTVDPHLHRIHSLREVFDIPALCVSSMPAITSWIGANVASPLLVGPGEESRQWVEPVARSLGAPWTTLSKERAGDRQVSVSLPEAALVRGRHAVLVDDIASSGRTLAVAARALRAAGAEPVTCVIVHALLDPTAEAELGAAGVARLVSTNTLVHSTNRIDIVPLVADGVRTLLDVRERPTSA